MNKSHLFQQLIFLLIIVSTSCDVVHEAMGAVNSLNLEKLTSEKALNLFNNKSPISTTFDDAIYEAEELENFEPDRNLFVPISLQKLDNNSSYELSSGLYSSKLKSFCLRGYTYGPTTGDGHLYAPLLGKKSEFVQLIIEKYGQNPGIEQNNIQVLLWAVIAGSDMSELGNNYSEVLNSLFDSGELLVMQGKDLLSGVATDQISALRGQVMSSLPSNVRGFIESDNKIRKLVKDDASFNAIEQIAILSGVAPERDMIRQVSKGRWSKHPDGYYIRFFPNGYQETQVDIYVPYIDETTGKNFLDANFRSSKLLGIKKVIYNPATMVASPANQSSQRVGTSSIPSTTIPGYERPEDCELYTTFDEGEKRYSKLYDGLEIRGSKRFIYLVEKSLSILRKDSPSIYSRYIRSSNNPQINSILKGIGIDCRYGYNTLDAFLYARLAIKTEKDYLALLQNPEILAGIIVHEATHVHQAHAYITTVGNGSFRNFIAYYCGNPGSFERAASKSQLQYLNLAIKKYKSSDLKYKNLYNEINRITNYHNANHKCES